MALDHDLVSDVRLHTTPPFFELCALTDRQARAQSPSEAGTFGSGRAIRPLNAPAVGERIATWLTLRRPDVRPDLRGHRDVFDVPGIREVHDADGSRAVSARSHAAIVIAGAGMATGGRVAHHLERFLVHGEERASKALAAGITQMDGTAVIPYQGELVRVDGTLA